MDQLVTRLKKTGARLIWAHTTVIPENDAGRIVGDDKKYNDAATRIMQKHGVSINDLHTLSSGFSAKMCRGSGDVHYRPGGYKKLAEKVAEKIREVIKSEAKDTKQPKPTHQDVSYGPYEKNVLDFWEAEGKGPRPLLVYIHGGGWVAGDKSKKLAIRNIPPFLEKGISYAAINYRHANESPLPTPVHDAARAIQFIRTKAREWNIDTSRIALTGGSAGACTSMWILLHDDLADPKAKDLVLRESTRVCAAAVWVGQTLIDPKVIKEWLGSNVLKHYMISTAVGEKTMKEALKNYEKHRPLYVEFSSYNHLSIDDPPLFMSYKSDMTLPSKNGRHGIHHPVYGIKMKEKADKIGYESYLRIRGVSKPEKYSSINEFLMAKLLEPKLK